MLNIAIMIISALIPVGLLTFYYWVTRQPKDRKEKTSEPEGKANNR